MTDLTSDLPNFVELQLARTHYWPRRQFCLRAVQAAVALAAYRLDHGGYPPELRSLLPMYLPEIPTDPYGADSPLRYRRVPTRGVTFLERPVIDKSGHVKLVNVDRRVAATGPHAWMLYSVGDDGTDNDGVLSLQAAYRGDWLVHLPGEPLPPQPKDAGDDPNDWGVFGYDSNF